MEYNTFAASIVPGDSPFFLRCRESLSLSKGISKIIAKLKVSDTLLHLLWSLSFWLNLLARMSLVALLIGLL